MFKTFDVEQLGNQMKEIEQKYAGELFNTKAPICVRLDGKGFSHYTSKLDKPFDTNFSELMIEVTKFLIKETNAVIGYTQSDEITLILYNEDPLKQIYFNGKIQKIVSTLASLATAKFNQLVKQYLADKNVPDLAIFDCRAWKVKDKVEAAKVLLWRECDATKNSVSIACRTYFNHSAVFGKKSKEMKKMLLEKGIDWSQYPNAFKFGTYLKREEELYTLSNDELDKIPKKHRPTEPIKRKIINKLDISPLSKKENLIDIIFKI